MRAFHLLGMIGSPLRYRTSFSLGCIWHGYLSYCTCMPCTTRVCTSCRSGLLAATLSSCMAPHNALQARHLLLMWQR